jgi:DNA-binding SARP family transcriptional activator
LRPPALNITQRLAEPILVADLGAVEVWIGPERARKPLRRKVLALLCYLASRPRMVANREQAIEALWPELHPDAAGNSLHQAIYHLRRVFEPYFREGMSAAYVKVDGDLVSLNPDLVDSTSRRCWRFLDQIRSSQSDDVDQLVETYQGRFALTFAYEEWAESYRENLHAAVLAATEASMARRRQAFDFEGAIHIGQRILSVDPDADGIELELLRSYKQAGRAAAAAEQYAHYSAYVRRELATEPPAWDEL